ncbi:MAG TPA: hypothetical protein EYG73_01970 [Arcobacter sp.]|nr:hypothetical protein [Arcobacter sp.]
MLKNIQAPQTIFGLKLKLLFIMIMQLVGTILLVMFVSKFFPETMRFMIQLVSILALVVMYIFLIVNIFQGKAWSKKALTYTTYILALLAIIFPIISTLLIQYGFLDPSSKFFIHNITLAKEVLTFQKLWASLLVLFSSALILNMLRKYTLFKLWDKSVLGRREHIYDKMSLGNSFVLGIFLTIIFYTILIMLPSSIELFQNLKKLFFGSHIIYYLIMIVFFWVLAILIDEYATAKYNRKLILEINNFFRQQDMYTIRHSELLELQVEFEKEFAPVTHTAITYKINYLLRHIELDKNNADTLMERLAEIEFQAQEYTQGFLHTLLWSLPLLGFMGTILGIIDTVGTFSNVLGKEKNAESLIESLGGLSLAFETTLLGLISSLIATYFFSIIRRANDQNSVTLSQLYEDEIISKLAK